MAVDPTNGNNVYVGSPNGKLYKSTDGGQAWTLVYERKTEADSVASLHVQFGKNNDAIFGGVWTPLQVLADVNLATLSGFGFSFKADGGQPRDVFVALQTSDGGRYRSRNVAELFAQKVWGDVVLTAADFTIDPELSSKSPEKIASLSPTPDWAKVTPRGFLRRCRL